MLLTTKCRLVGSTALVLALAGPPYLALANQAGDAVTSSPDTSFAVYGRAGGQTYWTAVQPTQPPAALTNAYEKTKEFISGATHDTAPQPLAGSADLHRAQIDAGQPVRSGVNIAEYGRAGTSTPWSTAQPTHPPQALTNAYETTKTYAERAYEQTREFLTRSSRQRASEQIIPGGGA